MRHTMNATGACCALALAASPVLAADKVSQTDNAEWISLTGKVKSVEADQFTLHYGEGQIDVEMDDYDIYNENLLLAGDQVTVTGRMDDDFYERKSIEASSVYVPKLNEYFFASSADEEDGYYSYLAARDASIVMTGTVTEIDGEEMKIDTGFHTFAVDGSRVENSPVGNVVDVGDRVSVAGEMDDVDLFDRREIEASSIVILTNNTV